MATTTTLSNGALMRPLGGLLRIYGKEAKYEFLKNLRIPRYSFSVILFALMFYVLFGLVMGRQAIANLSTSKYLIATYGTFGVSGSLALRGGGGPGRRAWPRMAASEARQPHASVCLFRG